MSLHLCTCACSDLHPNLWRPQRGELAHQLFVNQGTHVLQGGVSPCSMIKRLDVFKGAASSLCPCLKRLTINAFTFETVKEAFHRRIIIAVGCAAHTCYHAFLLEERLIAFTCVGTTSIGMVQSSGRRTTTSECHLESLHNRRRILGSGHRPSYHHSRKQVKHDCQGPATLLRSKWRSCLRPIWCWADRRLSSRWSRFGATRAPGSRMSW